MKKEELQLMKKCSETLEWKMEILKILNKFIKQLDKKVLSKLFYIVSNTIEIDEDFLNKKSVFYLNQVGSEREYELKWNFDTVRFGLKGFMTMPLIVDTVQEETPLKITVFIYKNNYPATILNDLSIKSLDEIISALSKENNLETAILISNGKVSASIKFEEYFYIKGV